MNLARRAVRIWKNDIADRATRHHNARQWIGAMQYLMERGIHAAQPDSRLKYVPGGLSTKVET